jgi:hypothetical protein
LVIGGLWAALLSAPLCLAAELATVDAAAAEFFERRIRPILVNACGECHLKESDNQGGLSLASRDQLLTGGDRGPALVPGDPQHSPLIEAINQQTDLKMPPDSRLSEQEIADLTHWVEMGAPWPDNAALVSAAFQRQFTADGFWAFQPLQAVSPPDVQNAAWVRNPLDRFILSGLEQHGLSPTEPADKIALLRRVTFDLIGLPPTPAEAADFLADQAPDAFQRLVDRLLDSPHYGERWGRHWLDLVRYADTNGIDNDYGKPNAFRYRDYVIDAFNKDLPYDLFIREHIAGDLLANPRTGARGELASPVGTGFYWLGEMLNAPADKPVALANELENRIDVLSKTFLGLTVACARCHDHKFDPISQADYYALAGFLNSSTNVQKCLDTPTRQAEIRQSHARIRQARLRCQELLERTDIARAWAEECLSHVDRVPTYLLAARDTITQVEQNESDIEPAADDVAQRQVLDAAKLRVLAYSFAPPEKEDLPKDPLFFPWQSLKDFEEGSRFRNRIRGLHRRHATLVHEIPDYSAGDLVDNFESGDLSNWHAEGEAFDRVDSVTGPFVAPTGPKWIGVEGRRFLSTDAKGNAPTGRLTSRKFKVTKPYLTLLIAGGNNKYGTGLQLIFNSQVLPEPEDVVATGRNSRVLERRIFNIRPYMDQEIWLEVVDECQGPWGHIVLDDIRQNEIGPTELNWPANRRIIERLGSAGIDSPADLALAYRDEIARALREWIAALDRFERDRSSAADPSQIDPPSTGDQFGDELLAWALDQQSILADRPIVELLSPEARAEYEQLQQEIARLEQSTPPSTIALVSVDEHPSDAQLHHRGNPHDLGAEIPRRPLQALAGESPFPISGSGRLQLADWIASPENPLTARVLVNRVWMHHLGRGIVPTPDNFGRLGESPSNLPLLDFLARQFIDSGWSIKQLHRLILNSSTYQQSHLTTPAAQAQDPANVLVHHVPARRLEGEIIRDALLAVSGSLDHQLHGPAVPTHLTDYMHGEDLPDVSGPMNGNNRRSIYLEVRRNHLHGLLKAFDFPRPETTIGDRRPSTVPAQALVLLNNELVGQQAEIWAQALLSQYQDPVQRVDAAYRQAFSRAAEPAEVQAALAFQTAQAARHQEQGIVGSRVELQSWTDLCHVLFNLAEFRYAP